MTIPPKTMELSISDLLPTDLPPTVKNTNSDLEQNPGKSPNSPKSITKEKRQSKATQIDAGTIIDDRYKIVRSIGTGGMGTVYEAIHLKLNKRFAIKIIIPSLSTEKEFVTRFKREANSLSRLDHPNCVKITDFGQTSEGTLYIVMEYLEGENLSLFTKERSLSVSDAIEITRQILMGVRHAHDAGIVHRDIKRENIVKLKTDDNSIKVKILDFGMAKETVRTNKDDSVTQTGLIMGTPQYLAPEILRDPALDHRTDLYAVGVTMFNMLVDRPIFKGNDIIEVLVNKSQSPTPNLEDFGQNKYPKALSIFLRQAIAERDIRFSSATQMLKALDKVSRNISSSNQKHENGFPDSFSSFATNAFLPFSQLKHSLQDALLIWYHSSPTTDQNQWAARMKALISTAPGRKVVGFLLSPFVLIAILGIALSQPSDSAIDPSHLTGVSHQGGRMHPTPLFEEAGGQYLFIEAQKLLDKKKCKQALELIKRKSPAGNYSANAHYLMGSAYMCVGKGAEGLASYEAALELDDRYSADSKILTDANKLIQDSNLRFEALEFIATSLGKTALSSLIDLAESHPQKKLRHKALAHIHDMNAMSHVDLAKVLWLDLLHSSNCSEMTSIVNQIADLGTPEAKAVLRRARDAVSENPSSEKKHKFDCVRSLIISHINQMRKGQN